MHKHIHENLLNIPCPRGFSAKEVLSHLQYLKKYRAISLKDPIEKRLAILIALFDCMEPQTADALREQLNIICEFKASK